MRAGAITAHPHPPPPSPSRSPSPHLPSATASPSSSPHRPLRCVWSTEHTRELQQPFFIPRRSASHHQRGAAGSPPNHPKWQSRRSTPVPLTALSHCTNNTHWTHRCQRQSLRSLQSHGRGTSEGHCRRCASVSEQVEALCCQLVAGSSEPSKPPEYRQLHRLLCRHLHSQEGSVGGRRALGPAGHELAELAPPRVQGVGGGGLGGGEGKAS